MRLRRSATLFPCTTLFRSGIARHGQIGVIETSAQRVHRLVEAHDRRRIEARAQLVPELLDQVDRKSTRLNSSHIVSSYAVFCVTEKSRQSQTTLHGICIAK